MSCSYYCPGVGVEGSPRTGSGSWIVGRGGSRVGREGKRVGSGGINVGSGGMRVGSGGKIVDKGGRRVGTGVLGAFVGGLAVFVEADGVRVVPVPGVRVRVGSDVRLESSRWQLGSALSIKLSPSSSITLKQFS